MTRTEPQDPLLIPFRRASPQDAPAIARFHVMIWRQTYGEIAPPEAYERLGEAHRLPYWQALLASDAAAAHAGRDTLLIEDAAGIAGLVSYGPGAPGLYKGRGEIRHLYIRDDRRGTGLGRRLFNEGRARIEAGGYPGMGLAVVRQNTAARRFYAGLGGFEELEFPDPGKIWQSENILVTWPALKG